MGSKILKKIYNYIYTFHTAHNAFANRIKMRWTAHFNRAAGIPEPTGLDFTIYNTIEEVPLDLWNRCNHEKDIFLSSGYLLALEKSPPENMQFRYVVFTEKKNPIAIVYFQILELNQRLHSDASVIKQIPKRSKMQDVHDKIVDSLSLRLLVCGNILLSGEHGYAILNKNEDQMLHAVIEAASEIKKIEKNAVTVTLVKDFYDRCNHSTNILSQHGFYTFDAGPNLVIPIRKNWTTFDEYLKQMKSKYRKRAASAIKKGAVLIKKSLDLDELIKYRNDLYALYCEVVNKAKTKLFILSPDYFIQLKRRLKDQFICDAYFHGDCLTGFTTRIYNNDTIEGYTHGLNYELNKSFELYQNFLFDDVRAAIDSHSSQINTGRTSIAMKSSAGAVADNMKCFIRFSGRISNHIVKPLFYFIKPSDEYCRNPFED